jgi:hypothetical protein
MCDEMSLVGCILVVVTFHDRGIRFAPYNRSLQTNPQHFLSFVGDDWIHVCPKDMTEERLLDDATKCRYDIMCGDERNGCWSDARRHEERHLTLNPSL